MADLKGRQIQQEYDNVLTKGTGTRVEDGDGVLQFEHGDKADLAGDTSQAFNVAEATEDFHATRKSQLDTKANLAGLHWTTRNSAEDNEWFSVTYGNGLFVAVAQTGTGNRVMTSPDGINWTIRDSATDNNWVSVTYGNGLFVAVARTGTGNRVMTSPDGINWTIRDSATDNNWISVTYGNGLFVAVANSGTGNRVMTSPDGINWTIRDSATDNNWISVTYGNGLFVAVANSGTGNRVMTSPDGINWTTRDSAEDNDWFSVTYGNGLFVAVANSGTGNRVMTSPDGINWTTRDSATDNNWFSVTYGNGLFVAVANSGTGNRVMTSPDGINWTTRNSAEDNNWRGVTYGNGLFVAVAYSGTGNRVMTSGAQKVSPDRVSIDLSGKASLSGSTSQAFNVAEATEDSHATQKSQLDTKADLAGDTFTGLVRAIAGINFNAEGGDTLDKYGIKVWTPTYIASETDFDSVTYNRQLGMYINIGRLYICSGTLRTSSVTIGSATGTFHVGGLPAPADDGIDTTLIRWAGSVGFAEAFTSGNHPSSFNYRGNTAQMIKKATSNGASQLINASDIATGADANSMFFTLIYIAEA